MTRITRLTIHVRRWATAFGVLSNFFNLIIYGRTNHSCERGMNNRYWIISPTYDSSFMQENGPLLLEYWIVFPIFLLSNHFQSFMWKRNEQSLLNTFSYKGLIIHVRGWATTFGVLNSFPNLLIEQSKWLLNKKIGKIIQYFKSSGPSSHMNDESYVGPMTYHSCEMNKQ